ncbi:hypothetical protein AB4254_09085 [Vibrio breoganii]
MKVDFVHGTANQIETGFAVFNSFFCDTTSDIQLLNDDLTPTDIALGTGQDSFGQGVYGVTNGKPSDVFNFSGSDGYIICGSIEVEEYSNHVEPNILDEEVWSEIINRTLNNIRMTCGYDQDAVLAATELCSGCPDSSAVEALLEEQIGIGLASDIISVCDPADYDDMEDWSADADGALSDHIDPVSTILESLGHVDSYVADAMFRFDSAHALLVDISNKMVRRERVGDKTGYLYHCSDFYRAYKEVVGVNPYLSVAKINNGGTDITVAFDVDEVKIESVIDVAAHIEKKNNRNQAVGVDYD